jgi:hypothetical protein
MWADRQRTGAAVELCTSACWALTSESATSGAVCLLEHARQLGRYVAILHHQHAGESTRRVVYILDQVTKRFSACQHGLELRLCVFGSLLFAVILELAGPPHSCHRLQWRAVEVVQVVQRPFVTRSAISSTSMPFFCGRFQLWAVLGSCRGVGRDV